jgi:hypothetical protein
MRVTLTYVKVTRIDIENTALAFRMYDNIPALPQKPPSEMWDCTTTPAHQIR